MRRTCLSVRGVLCAHSVVSVNITRNITLHCRREFIVSFLECFSLSENGVSYTGSLFYLHLCFITSCRWSAQQLGRRLSGLR